MFYFGKFEKYRKKSKEDVKKYLYSHHSEMISDKVLIYFFPTLINAFRSDYYAGWAGWSTKMKQLDSFFPATAFKFVSSGLHFLSLAMIQAESIAFLSLSDIWKDFMYRNYKV